MREILFRGKRTDNSEWVEGFLHIKYFQEVPRDRYVIEYETEPTKEWKPKYMVAEIIPETVGQYTGLTDKNGTKIFEGDIVDMHRKGCGFKPVECVKYEEGGFSPIAVAGWECTPQHNEIEVIGNIHDNPELLNPSLKPEYRDGDPDCPICPNCRTPLNEMEDCDCGQKIDWSEE